MKRYAKFGYAAPLRFRVILEKPQGGRNAPPPGRRLMYPVTTCSIRICIGWGPPAQGRYIFPAAGAACSRRAPSANTSMKGSNVPYKCLWCDGHSLQCLWWYGSTTDQSIGWFLNNTNTLSNDHLQLTRYAFGNPKMHLSRWSTKKNSWAPQGIIYTESRYFLSDWSNIHKHKHKHTAPQ